MLMAFREERKKEISDRNKGSEIDRNRKKEQK
jgi:hypothetical protein